MRYLLAVALLVPLKSIHSTTPKDGMQPAAQQTNFKQVADIRREIKGPSNAVLVEAETLDGAVRGSAQVLTGYASADRPVRADKSGSYWLVAYLGSGSSSRVPEVKGVAVDGKRVRFTFGKAKPTTIQTADVVPYLYWVPLGKLEPGAYQLELFDGEVRLIRRVEVR